MREIILKKGTLMYKNISIAAAILVSFALFNIGIIVSNRLATKLYEKCAK